MMDFYEDKSYSSIKYQGPRSLDLEGYSIGDEVEWDLQFQAAVHLPPSSGRVIAIVEGYLVIHNENRQQQSPTTFCVICKWPHEVRHVVKQ